MTTTTREKEKLSVVNNGSRRPDGITRVGCRGEAFHRGSSRGNMEGQPPHPFIFLSVLFFLFLSSFSFFNLLLVVVMGDVCAYVCACMRACVCACVGADPAAGVGMGGPPTIERTWRPENISGVRSLCPCLQCCLGLELRLPAFRGKCLLSAEPSQGPSILL